MYSHLYIDLLHFLNLEKNENYNILIISSDIYFRSTKSLNLGGYNIELGMDEEFVYELLGPKFRLDVDENDNLFISDNSSDNTIGIIYFKNERVNKIVRDWGTGKKIMLVLYLKLCGIFSDNSARSLNC